MHEITIPKRLVPLVKAFSADENSAKLLVREAAIAINSSKSTGLTSFTKPPSDEEIEGIVALMRGIDPKDTLEAIYAAQIIASHLMGLRLLSHEFKADQTLGLKLLQFSVHAMESLQRKRAGGTNQHISITYNNTAPAMMQTVIEGKRCQ